MKQAHQQQLQGEDEEDTQTVTEGISRRNGITAATFKKAATTLRIHMVVAEPGVITQ